MHLACLGAFLTGVNTPALLLCGVTYFVRMFGITAGYHRYFAHRAYKTSRVFQFVLAWLGCSAVQKGPLWWAAHHRDHHRYSDTPADPHSPHETSFWWSHVGWILVRGPRRHPLGADPRLVASTPSCAGWTASTGCRASCLAVLCWLVGGWAGLVWGFVVSTVLVYHATFTINSLSHLFGRRRYDTADESRNNLLAGADHAGRGLAQQPSPLPEFGQPGLLLVGNRHQLLRHPFAELLGLTWDLRKPGAKALTVSPDPEDRLSDDKGRTSFAGSRSEASRLLFASDGAGPSQFT